MPLKPGSEVRLTNVNGGVTVDAWDRNEVQIEAEKMVRAGSDAAARKLMGQIHIDVAPGPAGLRIDTRIPKREEGGLLADLFNGGGVSVGVTYKLHVPRHVALDVLTSNGAIQAGGTLGNAHLKTNNGGITVREVSGNLDLESSNGAIGVARSAGSLKAVTTNGAIDAELLHLAAGDLHLETTNGGVSVRLPKDARLSVDAETSNGGIHSDFPVPGGQPGKHSLKGEINGGGAKLFIRTSNGGVHIRQGPAGGQRLALARQDSQNVRSTVGSPLQGKEPSMNTKEKWSLVGSAGVGAGLGAGLMYLLDPQGGRGRRAVARDKSVSALKKGGAAAAKTSRDLGNKTKGLIADAGTKLRESDLVGNLAISRIRARRCSRRCSGTSAAPSRIRRRSRPSSRRAR